MMEGITSDTNHALDVNNCPNIVTPDVDANFLGKTSSVNNVTKMLNNKEGKIECNNISLELLKESIVKSIKLRSHEGKAFIDNPFPMKDHLDKYYINTTLKKILFGNSESIKEYPLAIQLIISALCAEFFGSPEV